MGRHSRHVGEQWIYGGALHKPSKFKHESVEHSFSVLFYVLCSIWLHMLMFPIFNSMLWLWAFRHWVHNKIYNTNKNPHCIIWHQLSYRSCMKMKAPKQISFFLVEKNTFFGRTNITLQASPPFLFFFGKKDLAYHVASSAYFFNLWKIILIYK